MSGEPQPRRPPTPFWFDTELWNLPTEEFPKRPRSLRVVTIPSYVAMPTPAQFLDIKPYRTKSLTGGTLYEPMPVPAAEAEDRQPSALLPPTGRRLQQLEAGGNVYVFMPALDEDDPEESNLPSAVEAANEPLSIRNVPLSEEIPLAEEVEEAVNKHLRPGSPRKEQHCEDARVFVPALEEAEELEDGAFAKVAQELQVQPVLWGFSFLNPQLPLSVICGLDVAKRRMLVQQYFLLSS